MGARLDSCDDLGGYVILLRFVRSDDSKAYATAYQ
jgi:hypothetical protein